MSHRSASSITWLETISVVAAVGEPVEQVPEVAAKQRVEADGRLVEDEQLRLAEERVGERDPCPLAAREPRDDAAARSPPRATVSISSSTRAGVAPWRRAK